MEQESKAYNDELQKLLETLDETYTSLSAEIDKNRLLVQELEKVKSLQSDYSTEFNQLKERIVDLENTIKELNKEKEFFKKRCLVIENSSLWKATKPIRKLLDSIKSIKRKMHIRSNPKEIKEAPIAKVQELKKTIYKPVKEAQSLDFLPRIELNKKYLHEFGFTEKALNELETLYLNARTQEEKNQIGWELILWYTNQVDNECAMKAIEIINSVKAFICTSDRLRRVAILEAESYGILGNTKMAMDIIQQEILKCPHSDLYLAGTTLETSFTKRIEWINQLMSKHDLMPLSVKPKMENKALFDTLEVSMDFIKKHKGKRSKLNLAKVSVIMPVFNSADVISTAIESVLNQTWSNLEILIVDDHSNDQTITVIKEFIKKDSRIRLMQTEHNSGTYVARNIALSKATGDFVTCHDADDWSHPEKIEIQVSHLLENCEVIANTSEWARASNDLLFHRKGAPGIYLTSNMSSLMFRREVVMEKLGFWDPVRFSADYEFITRIVNVFGQAAFVKLKTGLLSIGREAEGSLTSNNKFGFYGFMLYGVRREYVETFKHHHQNAVSLKYNFPQAKRLFPVPTPMLPERKSFRNNYDLIVGSDFRAYTLKDVEELKNFKNQVKNYMGIFQMSIYGLKPTPVTPEVRDLMDDNLRMIVYGEKVSCKLLILKYSEILEYRQKFIPEIKADKIVVIIDRVSDLESYRKNLLDYFGKEAKWYPLNSFVRQAIMDNSGDFENMEIENSNWVDIKGGIII